MSKRPIEAKERRRVAKKFRRDALPAYFDLVQWLIDNDHAKTKREARAIVLDERVRAGSHTLGVTTMEVPGPLGTSDESKVVAGLVSTRLRSEIMVLPPPDFVSTPIVSSPPC